MASKRTKTVTLKGAAAGALMDALSRNTKRDLRKDAVIKIHMAVSEGDVDRAVGVLQAFAEYVLSPRVLHTVLSAQAYPLDDTRLTALATELQGLFKVPVTS